MATEKRVATTTAGGLLQAGNKTGNWSWKTRRTVKSCLPGSLAVCELDFRWRLALALTFETKETKWCLCWYRLPFTVASLALKRIHSLDFIFPLHSDIPFFCFFSEEVVWKCTLVVVASPRHFHVSVDRFTKYEWSTYIHRPFWTVTGHSYLEEHSWPVLLPSQLWAEPTNTISVRVTKYLCTILPSAWSLKEYGI